MKFKANYIKEFEARREDALYIAALHTPPGMKCENVEEVTESDNMPELDNIRAHTDDLFESLAEMFKI